MDTRVRLDVPEPRWLKPLLRRITARTAPPDPLPAAPAGPRAGLLLGGICFVAVVITHQLTPVMLIASVVLLSLVTRRLPLWIPAVMIAVEAGWVALAWPYISTHFSVFDPALPGAAPSGRNIHSSLSPAFLSFYAPAAVVMLIGLLALIGGLRRLRAGHKDIAAVCLGLGVIPAAALQSYGGIGFYRAFLFALPWLAFFAAGAFHGVRAPGVSPRGRSVTVAVGATCAVAACLLIAVFGQDLGFRLTRDEVRAETWVEDYAPAGSTIVNGAVGPQFLTRRYPDIGYEDTLLPNDEFAGRLLGASDVPRVERFARQVRPGAPLFLVLTTRQDDYALLNGMVRAGSLPRLARALTGSRRFHLIYRLPTAWVFKYVPYDASRSKKREAPTPTTTQRPPMPTNPNGTHGHFIWYRNKWQLIGFFQGRWRAVGPGTGMSWSQKVDNWVKVPVVANGVAGQ